MREVFSSLRVRVLLLIAIPFAVMLGISLYHTLGERESELANARARVLDTARLLVAEQRRIVEHVRHVLLSAALLPEVRRAVASDACNRVLAAVLRQEPNLDSIVLALTNGDVICNATPAKGPHLSVADRAFFKAALQTGKFSESDYVINPIAGGRGIGFAYPVLDETGAPRSVVVSAISLAWLKQELAKEHLPEGARIGVADAKGIVLSRYPDPEGWVGKSAAESALWRRIVAKGGEGTEEDIGLDGRLQIFGYAPLNRTSRGRAYLWVGIPKDVVIGPTERAFIVGLLAELALLVLTCVVVWTGSELLFVRRIAALTEAAKELGQGNLAARAGAGASSDEIGKLAQSFDRMAQGLQTREILLAQAVRGLRVLSAANRIMLREEDGEQHLLDEMCQAIGEAGRYHLVWAGYAEDDAQKHIRPLAHWGSVDKRYFQSVELSCSESGNTPPGRAIRSGIPVLVKDIAREPGPGAWRDFALRCRCGSCVALPLRVDGRVLGVLNICATESDAFSDEEVELLGEAAAGLSFGIARVRAGIEQARMKRTLKTAEERYSAAAEANLDALFIMKSVRDGARHIVDFEFTDINAHAEAMLGMVREKVIGQKLCELIPSNRTHGFLEKYAQVVATGTALDEEFPIDAPELKAKWLRHQVVRVGDGIAIFSRDVTLWKESGARLKESEERLRLATDAAHIGTWAWNAKSNRFSWSEGVGPVFGLPPGEGFVTPEELIEAVHPADRGLVARASSEGRGKGTPVQVEFRIIWPDGTLHWVEIKSDFVCGATGAPERGVGIAMDITERKRAAQALTASEKKFRDLVETTSDWVWEVDETGIYTYASPKVRDLLGYAPEELVGKSPFELMPPAEGARVAAIFGAVLGERKPLIALENINLHKDGHELVLESSGVPIFDVQGAFKGYRGIDRDITGRKQGELALGRANRALRTLSACNEALIHAVTEPELLHTVCRLVVEEGGYCMAWVGGAEHNPAKTVRILARYGADEGYLASRALTWTDTEHGHGPTGTAIRTGATQVNTSFLSNPNVATWRDAALARGFQSSIAMPLKGPSGTFGSLTIYAREPDAFNENEVHLLEELAGDLAFGIATLRTRAERDRMTFENQHHEAILRKSLEDSIQAIANTVEMRDPYTAGHQTRVGKLAAAIASELGLAQDEIHGIQLAATIHDLGKIRVPAEILSKPGKLTDIEFALIKAHTQAGYDILKGIEFPWPIADMVLQHHERLGGSGYPQGLKGDQIVLGARILAVADVIEAMASHRPYRVALGIDVALAEIVNGRGALFDSAAVDACLKLFREGQFAFQT